MPMASNSIWDLAAFLIVGVPNAALWGAAAMFLRFVPVIGVCLSALPRILLAAAVDPGWSAVIVTAAAFLAGEMVFGHVLEPMLLGRGSGMPQFAIITATAFWALVWGPIGLILAAPLSMCLVVLGQNFPKFEFITLVLGDQPALSPEHEFYHRLLSEDIAAAVEQLDTTSVEGASQGAVAEFDDSSRSAYRGARPSQSAYRSGACGGALRNCPQRDDAVPRRLLEGESIGTSRDFASEIRRLGRYRDSCARADRSDRREICRGDVEPDQRDRLHRHGAGLRLDGACGRQCANRDVSRRYDHYFDRGRN